MMPEEMLPTDVEILPTRTPQVRTGVAAKKDELDVLELIRVLLRKKILILKFAIIPAVLAALVLIFIEPTYTAEATFLPPNSMSSGSSSAVLGQLGALGVAGGALGGLRDPSLIYVGMLASHTIADSLIRQFDLGGVYKTKKLSQTEKALAIRSKFVTGKDAIVTVNVEDHDPKRAADLANAYLVALRTLNDRIAVTEASQKRLFFEQQLDKEKNLLADAEVDLARSQEQSGLIQPGGQARLQLETIAQTQAEISSREIQLASMSQAATEQNPDVLRIRSEIASLKAQLGRLENANNRQEKGDVQVPTARVPELTLMYVRRARDVKYHEALYELLLRQYESAKMDESRSAPLMQIVDYATVPDSKSGPQRSLVIMLSFIFGGFVGIVWVFAQHGLQLYSNTYKQEPLV